MSDILTVREACEHGWYDGHIVMHGLECGPDCEYEHRTDDECEGGREITATHIMPTILRPMVMPQQPPIARSAR